MMTLDDEDEQRGKMPRLMEPQGEGNGAPTDPLVQLLNAVNYIRRDMVTREDLRTDLQGMKVQIQLQADNIAVLDTRMSKLEQDTKASYDVVQKLATATMDEKLQSMAQKYDDKLKELVAPKIHNFTTAYSIAFETNEQAKEFVQRVNAFGVQWHDPMASQAVDLKVRMDVPVEISRVNRLLGILWSKVHETAIANNKCSVGYRLGAQGYRGNLWLMQGDEVDALFTVKGAETMQTDIQPNMPKLMSLGFTEQMAMRSYARGRLSHPSLGPAAVCMTPPVTMYPGRMLFRRDVKHAVWVQCLLWVVLRLRLTLAIQMLIRARPARAHQ
ncbi:unnamed protein product [Prorocentrum cordatum]|uniref:Uncharacterized protein n=1 Tax=Prorocentrum cordatum TaxID=2364126 RepID=A0ABN9XF65_9DINO|nr:unnamed protein product [Polarella glacialis]